MPILSRARRMVESADEMLRLIPSMPENHSLPAREERGVANALIRMAPLLTKAIDDVKRLVGAGGTYEPEQWPHIEEARRLLAELKSEEA